MKLLFDQNLSPGLVKRLADLYPDSVHVSQIGLDRSLDSAIWDYARNHDLMIVSKDADFGEMSVLTAASPKVIWLRLGNCSTEEIEAVLRSRYDSILTFCNDPKEVVMILL